MVDVKVCKVCGLLYAPDSTTTICGCGGDVHKVTI